MRTFHALAAVFALVVLARHGPAALRRLGPRRGPDAEAAPADPGRLAALVPLLACLAALAVLAAAGRGLLLTGATP